jgi:tetratricopeptide (TPR) repeat protein
MRRERMNKIYVNKIGDAYLISTGGFAHDIEIDGNVYKEVKRITMPNKPEEIYRIVKSSKLRDYTDLSVKEYDHTMNEKWPYKDSNDNPVFRDEKEKHTYEEFLKDHPARFEPVNTKEEMEIIYREYAESDNPLIKSIRATVFDEHAMLFEYIPDINHMMKEYDIEYKLHENTTTRFMKLEGKYIQKHREIELRGAIGTYEECLECYNEHHQLIKEIIEDHRRRISNAMLTKRQVGTLYSACLEIEKSLINMNVFKSSMKKYRFAQDQLRELIEILANYADEGLCIHPSYEIVKCDDDTYYLRCAHCHEHLPFSFVEGDDDDT